MAMCSRGVNCQACKALEEECGDAEIFEFYKRKLLIRGWAGMPSPVEKAYQRAHRTEEQQAKAMEFGARMRALGKGFAPKAR